LRILSGIGGTFIAIGLSIYLGVEAGSFIVFILALAVLIFIVVRIDRALDKAGRIDMEPWLSQNAGCKYKYAWDGDGIAVDTDKQVVHLVCRSGRTSIAKSYALSDVREWGYEAPGSQATRTYGNVGLQIGTQVAAENLASVLTSIENTGLWLKVRDIEFPRWFIKFRAKAAQDKTTLMELAKWVEILNQTVNNERATSGER